MPVKMYCYVLGCRLQLQITYWRLECQTLGMLGNPWIQTPNVLMSMGLEWGRICRRLWGLSVPFLECNRVRWAPSSKKLINWSLIWLYHCPVLQGTGNQGVFLVVLKPIYSVVSTALYGSITWLWHRETLVQLPSILCGWKSCDGLA